MGCVALGLLLACGEDGDGDDGGNTGGTSSGGTSQGSGGADGSGGKSHGAGGEGGVGGEGTGGLGVGGDGSGGSVGALERCATTIGASENGFVELCEIDGPVRHVKIEGLLAPRTHLSSQILFGASAAPSSTNPALGEGELRVLFYGGGTPFPTPQLEVGFGSKTSTLSSNASFVNASSTVCFDLHQGSETEGPHVVLWVEGQNGADCDDADTLTLESAFARDIWWEGAVTGAIAADRPTFFYQGAPQEVTVTLSDSTVLTEALPTLECEQEISAAGSFVELCALGEPARHVRIEGLVAGSHQSTQVVFGFEEAPTNPQAPLDAGQFRTLFYAGGTPAPPAQISASFAGKGASWTSGVDFLGSSSTVCFDVHDGSETTPPYFVLWVDGRNSADCEDRSTLTLSSAFAVETSFEGTSGAIHKDLPLFFRKAAAGNATVYVSSLPALTASQIAAGTTCTTTWASNIEWQRLCTPAAGQPRHVRIEDVGSAGNSSYFYLILGEPTAKDSGATTAPSVVEGSGTFILTGGRNHLSASATSFRFDSNTQTSQYDLGGLYTPSPSTICLDLGENDEGHLQILLWATGQNDADCQVRSTLTRARAVYSSATNDVALWAKALSETGFNYVKTNNANGSIGRIVLSTELAVH